MIQLPPDGLDEETEGAWLDHVAEHVAEFHRNAYAVVLIDDGRCRERLTARLAALGVAPLPEADGTAESLRTHGAASASAPVSAPKI